MAIYRNLFRFVKTYSCRLHKFGCLLLGSSLSRKPSCLEGRMLDNFERIQVLTERKELHCISCKRVTIHNLEGRCTGSWQDRPSSEKGGASYSIFRCGACDAVCYETISWNTLDTDYDENGEEFLIEKASQYPAPVSAHFDFNTESTPGRLDDILEEMLYALAGSKTTLATIGLRLAVEFIVKDKKCAGKDLASKIDNLREQALIDDDQKELLHRIRLRGNASAHEASGMNSKELIAGMSIIEGLLENLYNGPARHASTIEKAQKLIREDIQSPGLGVKVKLKAK